MDMIFRNKVEKPLMSTDVNRLSSSSYDQLMEFDRHFPRISIDDVNLLNGRDGINRPVTQKSHRPTAKPISEEMT
jgi:hypothetical protein